MTNIISIGGTDNILDIGVSDSPNYTLISARDPVPLLLKTNSIERLRIDSSGIAVDNTATNILGFANGTTTLVIKDDIPSGSSPEVLINKTIDSGLNTITITTPPLSQVNINDLINQDVTTSGSPSFSSLDISGGGINISTGIAGINISSAGNAYQNYNAGNATKLTVGALTTTGKSIFNSQGGYPISIQTNGIERIGIPYAGISNDNTITNILGLSGGLGTTLAYKNDIVDTSAVQRLTNKNLAVPSCKLIDNSDSTKIISFNDSAATTGTTLTFIGAQTANRSLTLPDATGTLALTSQIPTNSTYVDLTSPQTISGVKTFSATPVISSISNTGTLTLPTSTDTLVGRATTDTLTNKTLTLPVISSISNTGTLTLPTGTRTLVGRDTSDTLTNKTIDSASNTLTITNSPLSAANVNSLINQDIRTTASPSFASATLNPTGTNTGLTINSGAASLAGIIVNATTGPFISFNKAGTPVLQIGQALDNTTYIDSVVGGNDLSISTSDAERLRIPSAGIANNNAITNILGLSGTTLSYRNDLASKTFKPIPWFGYSITDNTYSVNTTLTADVYWRNMTVNTGVSVYTAGYRLFVNGVLTLSGSANINNNGNNAIGQTGGVGLGVTTINGFSNAGGNGGAILGNGTSGSNTTAQVGSSWNGGAGGAGSGTGGSGGVGTVLVASDGGPHPEYDLNVAIRGRTMRSSLAFGGGPAGGGGSGGTVGVGGGGGAGGGFVLIVANTITGSGTVSAIGGNGADGVGLSSGGGGSGAGGLILIVANTLSGGFSSSSCNVSAGTVGAGGGGGNAGSAGNAGLITII